MLLFLIIYLYLTLIMNMYVYDFVYTEWNDVVSLCIKIIMSWDVKWIVNSNYFLQTAWRRLYIIINFAYTLGPTW